LYLSDALEKQLQPTKADKIGIGNAQMKQQGGV
jgi:hypothetical protein